MMQDKELKEYSEVLEIIENSRRFGKLPGYDVTKQVLKILDYPSKDIPYVHIAGTNGKGSSCAFLSSIMRKAGIKTGTFTSPHLVDFEERITVDGAMIPKEDVVRLGKYLLNIDFGVELTMFDYCLAMAVLYFKEQECELMIIETGLGGKLDSTNALGVPEVSVITKIGFDHMAILGDTLTKIAREKAGIIKSDSYVVLEQQEEEAKQELISVINRIKPVGYEFVSDGLIELMSGLEMKMLGVHQWENAAVAYAAARRLGVDEAAIIDGIRTATWGGRLEIVSEEPFFLLDGAHNGNGVEALRNSLETLYPGEKFHFIMGVMADKDYKDMVEHLLPLALDFATVTPESTRALQAAELADFIRAKGISVRTIDNVASIFEGLSKNDRTVAFGSLYFIGEIKKIVPKSFGMWHTK